MKQLPVCATLGAVAIFVGCQGAVDQEASQSSANKSTKKVQRRASNATQESEGSKVDRTNPGATAKAVLQAYEKKDLMKLSELCTGGNREMIAEIARRGEEHPRYGSLFSGWRWEAVADWTGQIDEVRFPNTATAMVKFGEIGADEIAVVTLNWSGNRWCFEDINSPSREHFESESAIRD